MDIVFFQWVKEFDFLNNDIKEELYITYSWIHLCLQEWKRIDIFIKQLGLIVCKIIWLEKRFIDRHFDRRNCYKIFIDIAEYTGDLEYENYWYSFIENEENEWRYYWWSRKVFSEYVTDRVLAKNSSF